MNSRHHIRLVSKAIFLLPGMIWLGVWLGGCGGSPEEQLQTPVSEVDEALPDTAGQKDVAAFETFVEERKTRGDTVAIHHDRLARLLPGEIPGYQLDIDKAATFETNRFTFSEATRVFYNEREDYIEFIAGDYVDDPDFFKVNLQRYNLAQGVKIDGVIESKESTAGRIPAGSIDYFIWTYFSKSRQLYRLYVGCDYRYFVTVEMSGRTEPPVLDEVLAFLDWPAMYEER